MMPGQTQPEAHAIEPMRFVRVQDHLHGMSAKPDGSVVLRRGERSFYRNTCHFAVNGAVGNHAYGSFDGGIVIIADPAQMGVPSGLTQSDVWFHHDADGELNVGRATVIAPEGMEMPVGVHVIRYDPAAPDARDRAVNELLASAGIAPRRFGMWSWAGTDAREHARWQGAALAARYPGSSDAIQTGPHSNSLDCALDDAMNACEGTLMLARDRYLIADDTGLESPSTNILAAKIEHARQCAGRLRRVGGGGAAAAHAYLDRIEVRLDAVAHENSQIKERFEAPYFVVLHTGRQGPFRAEQVDGLIACGTVGPLNTGEDIRFSDGERTVGELFADVVAKSKPPTLAVESNADAAQAANRSTDALAGRFRTMMSRPGACVGAPKRKQSMP